MKIEGIKGCYEKIGGMFYFARMCSKIRLQALLIYNSFMSKRGWHDDETDEFIPAAIKEDGVQDDGRVITDFDLIEMDEGRWYPEMWRDAWK